MPEERRRTRRLHDLLLAPVSPTWVTVGAIAVVVVLVVLLSPFESGLWRELKPLLLVVPVIGAAALGGRRAGYIVAATAGLAFSLSVPPVGSIRLALAEDAVALVVFLTVAVVVSTIVAARFDALAEVDKQRTLLLRSVSHDLRTPLATIRAASTDLLDDVHDRETSTQLLRLIDLEAARLDRLVANLLELSRLESGAMVPRRDLIDADVLVRHVLPRFSRLPREVTIAVEIPDDAPVVDADPTQIELVLANLLDNAIRHSPDGGEVALSVASVPGGVTLAVSDRGPGVSQDEADLIFQPFRSGTLAGSSGVGLAISRAIVERHGGTIDVDDRPGGGARFVVTLPYGG